MKIGLIITGLVVMAILPLVLAINRHIDSYSEQFIYTEIEEIPNAQVVIIPGARVLSGGRLSDILLDRAKTAVNLYRSGKVDKILISGDHGRKEYDEVNAVKDYLLENGIKGEDIFMDHAGFDTYDTLYRAAKIFEVNNAIIATQKFHLPRAVYIGRRLDIELYGLSADLQPYVMENYNLRREKLAKVKAFFNILLKSEPKFLGEKIPITGDGRLSWD